MAMSTKLALFTIAVSLAFLGLAVLGWGGFAAFFSHPPLIALTMVFFAMLIVAFFSVGNLSSGERENRSNRWVLVAFTVVALLAGYLPAYTDRKDFLPWTATRLMDQSNSLRRRRCAADLASLCARPSLQRAGSDTARPYAGHR